MNLAELRKAVRQQCGCGTNPERCEPVDAIVRHALHVGARCGSPPENRHSQRIFMRKYLRDVQASLREEDEKTGVIGTIGASLLAWLITEAVKWIWNWWTTRPHAEFMAVAAQQESVGHGAQEARKGDH